MSSNIKCKCPEKRKTTNNQIRAIERKEKNKLKNINELEEEAENLNITVVELKSRKMKECKDSVNEYSKNSKWIL
ncbi:MAG: hypothetical protein ABIG10_01295 [bacterium]